MSGRSRIWLSSHSKEQLFRRLCLSVVPHPNPCDFYGLVPWIISRGNTGYVYLTGSQAGEKESEERRLEGGDLDVEGQEDDQEETAKATTTMTVGGAAASANGGSRGGGRAAAAMGGSGGFPGGKSLARTAVVQLLSSRW